MHYAQNVLELVGNTPLVRLNSMAQNIEATILLKLESKNPGGSIKDRIGIAMLEDAERRGAIQPGGLIIEPTSGNTGIGLALAARLKGYRCLFVMTDKASQERIRYLKAMGADVMIVSSAAKPNSPEYYFNMATRLASELPNAVMLNQYDNPANPGVHERTTGPEIWRDTDGKITHFICGIGTGGTITGCARYLKHQNSAVKVIAADPIGSAIKMFKDTGRLVEPLPYLVEGVGQERIPGNLDLSLVDDIINISDKESFHTAKRLALEEGIFCGGSSGMNVAAALRTAKTLPKESVVVVIISDTGERYLTKHHSEEWMKEKALLDSDRITLRSVITEKSVAQGLPAVIAVSPECTVDDVLQRMSKYEISEIPVIDEGELLGTVRENRLMARVIADRSALSAKVSLIMDESMPQLDANDDIQSAIALLKEHPAIVILEFGRVMGVLSRHDVLGYLQ
ncbi:cystathionine beta-synthase [Ignavibacteria bacterium]|nr:cysteine synthase [Bacteroidota bacterium]MCZ2133277.1 cysteine synthase [Bacteroidota bacterium]